MHEINDSMRFIIFLLTIYMFLQYFSVLYDTNIPYI